MSKITWTTQGPTEPLEPLPDCPTGGFDSHEWELTIEEGQPTLQSGCVSCDDIVGGLELEDIHMTTAVRCRLASRLEVYGWETTEYDHWWDITPIEGGLVMSTDNQPEDVVTVDVFIETPCICDHSTTVDIPQIEWDETTTDDERDDLVGSYAQDAFHEACNYGWSTEPKDGGS